MPRKSTSKDLELKYLTKSEDNDMSSKSSARPRRIESKLNTACLLLWPLLCSVTVLFFSTVQERDVKRLLSIRALLSDINENSISRNTSQNLMRQTIWDISDDARSHSNMLKTLKEKSRSKFIRLKGIPEDENEKTDEKITELLQYLGFMITDLDIERANRVGKANNNPNQPRAIIAELSNYKLKMSVLREAATKLRHTPYSILDDETFVVVESDDVFDIPRKYPCGVITAVSDPITWKKAGRMFGFWGKDPGEDHTDEHKIWVMEHFYRNTLIVEYNNLLDFLKDKIHENYTVPYNWAGTGHTIYNNAVYFNKFNTSMISKYDFTSKRVVAERNLPSAGFGNMAPYQWAGSTDIDFAVDELGLWVIYATLENSLDIVVSKLDEETLEVTATYRTNWRKQWSGNAFMACGVLYVVKKYDEKFPGLNYMYNTHTQSFKFIDIPFQNKYEWNTMVDYNPESRELMSWDRGHQVSYTVTMDRGVAPHDAIGAHEEVEPMS